MAEGHVDVKRYQIISLLYIIFICFSVISIKITILDSNIYTIKSLQSIDKEELKKVNISNKIIDDNKGLLKNKDKAQAYLKIRSRLKISREVVESVLKYVDDEFAKNKTSILKEFNSKNLIEEILKSDSGVKLLEKDFNSICKIAFLKLIKTKPIFENYHGKLGQLRLFQNAHYSFKDINNQSTPLIHSHFAQLNGVGKNLTLLTNSFAEKSGTKWNPSSIFPEIEEDILLYLILMGGLNFSAFNEASKPVPYAYFLIKARNDLNHRSHVLDFSNSNQTSNDGMFLESLLCATVCLASHTNGFQGVPLKSFLLNLLYQLQNEKVEYDDVSLADFDLIEDKFRLDIPYFSPPNQKWPSYLNIPNSNMQNLERTKNKDKVDLMSSCGLVGESKDYQSVININTMRQILKRVPQEAKLELVFVRKLQNSYFQGVSFEEEFAESHLLNKSFFRIDASKPATSIENIIGLPTGKYDGIVLFIEIDKSISSNITEK